MRDHPILFSTPMVRALIAGTKTQTRRILKPQPPSSYSSFGIDARNRMAIFGFVSPEDDCNTPVRVMPKDRLWVRETWGSLEADHTAASGQPGYRRPQLGDRIVFQADPASAVQWGRGLPSQGAFMWRPSIHMPRWASRITLIVEEVRVERLQDISEGDAIAEGVQCDTDGYRDYLMPTTQCCATARDSYQTLWDHINAEGAWAANPWICAITFDPKRGNIDAL